MMCYLGLTQSHAAYTDKYASPLRENPFANITDYESYHVASKNFNSLESAMADIYARDFMQKMHYNLREQIPLMEFKKKLLTERHSIQDSFTLLQPFLDHL